MLGGGLIIYVLGPHLDLLVQTWVKNLETIQDKWTHAPAHQRV